MSSSSTKKNKITWKNHLPDLILSNPGTRHPPKLDSSPSHHHHNTQESDNGSAIWYSVPGDDVTFVTSQELPRGDHSLFLGDPQKCHVASTMSSRILSSESSERLMSPWRNISLYPSSSTSLTPSLCPPSPPRSPSSSSISPTSTFSRTSTSSSSSSSFPLSSSSSSSSFPTSFPSSFPSPFYYSKDSSSYQKNDILFRFVCTTPMGSPTSSSHPSTQNPKTPFPVNNAPNFSLPDKPRDYHSPYNLGFLPQTMIEIDETISESTTPDGTDYPGIRKSRPENRGSGKYSTEKFHTAKNGTEKSGTVNGTWAPVEVVDIGVRAASAGEVYLVRAVAGVRTGGVWRVVGIAEDDAMSPLLKGLRDVTAFLPGRMEALSKWLQMTHAESPSQEGMDELSAVKMVQLAHAMWQLKTRFLFRSLESASHVSPNNVSATWQPCSAQPADDVSRLLSLFRNVKGGNPTSNSSVSGPPDKKVSWKVESTNRQKLNSRTERTEEMDASGNEVSERWQRSYSGIESTEQKGVSKKDVFVRCRSEPISMLEKAKGVIRRMTGKMGKVSHGVSNLITRRHSVTKTTRLEKVQSLDERIVNDLEVEEQNVLKKDKLLGRRSVDSSFVVEREKMLTEQILMFEDENASEIQEVPENRETRYT